MNSTQYSQNPFSAASLLSENLSGLTLVEERIRSSFRSNAPQLTEISQYLLSLGGKRIRPLLAVVTGRLFGMYPPSAELVSAAAGIELIHMATLLHDDIIDESPVRRNRTSAYIEFGLAPSLITGDFLLARAFGLCAHLDLYVIEATEQACVELTEGEVLEGHLDPKNPSSLEDYLTVVRGKTASLFALASAVGAHISGASERSTELLKDFGYLAGISFQMVDDILDVTADEDLLGKPTGTDLRQKTPSLVNILWLTSGDPEAVRFFNAAAITEQEAKAAAQLLRADAVREGSVIQECRKTAEHYARLAQEKLLAVDDQRMVPAVRDQLIGLLHYTLERVK